MLAITTKWIFKKDNKTDEQETTQHFMDVPHYRDYQYIMRKRGYTSVLVSVKDTVTDQEAEVDGDKITFSKV